MSRMGIAHFICYLICRKPLKIPTQTHAKVYFINFLALFQFNQVDIDINHRIYHLQDVLPPHWTAQEGVDQPQAMC